MPPTGSEKRAYPGPPLLLLDDAAPAALRPAPPAPALDPPAPLEAAPPLATAPVEHAPLDPQAVPSAAPVPLVEPDPPPELPPPEVDEEPKLEERPPAPLKLLMLAAAAWLLLWLDGVGAGTEDVTPEFRFPAPPVILAPPEPMEPPLEPEPEPVAFVPPAAPPAGVCASAIPPSPRAPTAARTANRFLRLSCMTRLLITAPASNRRWLNVTDGSRFASGLPESADDPR